ncbi:unnamed protein product [Camellia sinensis]
MAQNDDTIRDFPHDFKSYVKNHQLLCERQYSVWCRGRGWFFWSGEDDPRELPPPSPPPPPPCSEIINGTLIASPNPEEMARIKSSFKKILFWGPNGFLTQLWTVIKIGGKRLLTTRHQPFGFRKIDEGLCSYRLISLDYEFDVDGVSDEHLGLHRRVFRHQQLEFTPNVQYYSCKEYPQRDHAISCNIKLSLAVPLFQSCTRSCIGVIEMVSTTEITSKNLGSMLRGVVGRAFSSQNLVFCKDVTQFSITEYPLAHYARKFGLAGSFAICLRSSYIEDNVYVLEFFLPPNYSEGRNLKTALVPLLTTMKQHCKSLKAASGEELEELSIEVLDFSEDGKLYSYQIPQTARSPNRMEGGEEILFLDLFDQQLLEVDAVDTENNVVTNTEENNFVVTSVQQHCIINSSQRLQRKDGIPISREDLQQRFGMKLKDVAESLGISRSTVKRACREYNITWWSPSKRSKDNQLLSNKLVQGVVQEQILESSQPQISDPPHMQYMATASRTKPHFTTTQDTSIVTIKAKYGDDFIKFQLPVSSGMVEFQ